MKIAYFTDSYLPKIDGVTFVVDTWAELLSARHEVRIYAPAYSRKRKTEVKGKVLIERFPSLPVPTYKQFHLIIPDLLGQIRSTAEGFGPDIIHFHTPGLLGLVAVRLANKTKIPLVGTYHTLLSEMLPNMPPFETLATILEPGNGDDGLIRKAAWGISKAIYAKSDLIISPAESIKRDLRQHEFKNWIEVVSNGIETEKFIYKPRNERTGVLLLTGRVSFEKNIDVVIRAMQYLPDLKLLIAGDGPAAKDLNELTRELGLSKRVTFLGYVPREKLVKYYQRADLFVTASTMEVQPMVILEAMSCGLPVVAINKAGLVGGTVNPGKNGDLIDEPNPLVLADKVKQVLNDYGTWKNMSENARKTAEKNSVDKSVRRMEKLYRELKQEIGSR